MKKITKEQRNRYMKKWRMTHRDKLKDYMKRYNKEYNIKHKTAIAKQRAEYRLKNKNERKAYYIKNRDKINEHKRLYRLTHKEQIKLYNCSTSHLLSLKHYRNSEKGKKAACKHRKKWINLNGFKVIAQRKAKYHIKLDGKVCELCKINRAEHRHHEDYSKPLDVVLLCRTCHNKIHYEKSVE